MAGQVLHVVERNALRQKVGYRRHAKRVRRESGRQSRSVHSPLHHAAHVNSGHGVRGQNLGPTNCGEEERGILVLPLESGRLNVSKKELLEVVADWDFAGFAPILRESKRPLGAVVLEVLHSKLGDGSNAGSRVNHVGNRGPVANTNDIRDIN
jgi:hypothetical protein